MSNLTRQKIFEKIENFDEYLNYLKQLQAEAKDRKTFLSDFHLFGNTERYLHLCIQVIIDIGHLIIIDLELKKPESNYDAISIIFGKRIISEKLADKLTAMIGLRNILVHEYGKIDRERIYEVLKKQVEDLEEFKRQILKFLERK